MLEGDAPGEITERDPPASALRLYTIPAHRAFADALVAGLRRQVGDDPLALARGLILLPNNRSKRAIQDAFVRASGGGLLLPRLVTIGDPALDEASGVLFDPADDPEPLPPAVAPMVRRLTLARLVAEERPGIGADEAVRLAGELARTLDQLLVEEVSPGRLRELELSPELSEHWRRALSLFRIVLDRWPAELARLGAIDAADRRTRMLSRLARRWRDAPPPGFVCAAGVTDPAPSVARLLRTVARMPRGSVVFPDLAIDMPEEEWDALGPHPRDPVTGIARRSIETHPQFQLKLLLTRMGAQRGEVALWRGGTDLDATLARGRAIANALSPAAFTGKWTDFPADRRRLAGIAAVEVATMAEEAQAVALALREALETPGRTAALVTPDRNLARRVAAHCRRWGIEVDDSAGRPLALTPPGTFFVALAEAAAQDVAPLPLLALLKHPLVRAGEARPAWLASVRALDRALRGPRPSPGLAGIAAHLADAPERERPIRAAAAKDWPAFAALLTPLAEQFARGPQPLADWIAGLREAGQLLCGDALWAGPAGRAAAELIASLEAAGGQGPALVEAAALAPLLRVLMAEVAVRPPQGGHPRLAIYGLIEARLQRADLMILGGLNEGTWPGAPAPDPWLAPRVRAELGLPGLERGVGIAAHDLASALGAPRALITRARRGGQGPALASRFWLRLEALAGERFERATTLEAWARALDDPGVHAPAERPAPSPRVDQRPTAISVTEVDRLKADPFAFYARRVLRLSALDPVDAEPSPAWRGDAVHAILRAWAEEDDGAPDRLVARARALLDHERTHPMIRALWAPRLIEAVEWIAAEMTTQRAAGRTLLAVERRGVIEIAGVKLSGTFDRLDRLPSGGLAIVDYKTGAPPSTKAVREGFSLQLGLLGLIAERAGFDGIAGRAEAFEYWSLSRSPRTRTFGWIDSPCDPKKREPVSADGFAALAAHHFTEAAAKWLTGDAPFEAKLHPEYAPYADYDQLMRLEEWYGRG